MNTNISKIYPVSSDSVAEMLGLSSEIQGEKTGKTDPETFEVSPGSLPVRDLPVVQTASPVKGLNQPAFAKADVDLEMDANEGEDQASVLKKFVKSSLPYLLVFLVGSVAYYFFFANTSLNLSGLLKSKPQEKIAPLTVKDTALMKLQEDPEYLKRYQAWIAQFYFEVTDPEVLDPNSDNSGNGLTNFQKFLLDLNPKAYDTLGLGLADSQAIAQGLNSLTGGQLSQKQKDLIEKYFDMEIINNRLAVEQLSRGGLVAGSQLALGAGFQTTMEATRSGNLRLRQNGFSVGNQFSNSNLAGSSQFGGYDNSVNPEINTSDLNTDAPGRLEVPALNINVPIIFSKSAKSFEKDLQLGVVHYPGTALPGQIGTTYISGHSGNYAFAKGNYNKVFSKLDDLPDNSSFIVTVVQKNGKDARFHYVVTHRKEFSPTDQEQFRNTGESMVALSTCWPVGSTKSRLVVFGKLTQIEK